MGCPGQMHDPLCQLGPCSEAVSGLGGMEDASPTGPMGGKFLDSGSDLGKHQLPPFPDLDWQELIVPRCWDPTEQGAQAGRRPLCSV